MPDGTVGKRAAARDYVLDIVIPVFNEERDLPGSVRRLHHFLATEVPYAARITVADNASTDGTLAVARQLARELPDVDVIHLDAKGRGGALHEAWMSSTATVVAYMDVDLSTDLTALMPLVAPLISGHSDVAIGSRLSASSRVVRGPKREFVSRSYNLILRSMLGARFSDAQCGFKAVRADVAQQLLPLVADTGWFFDTELLVIAERARLRIHEVPVDWIDDPDSRVDVLHTAIKDLKGCWRVGRALATGALPVRELQASLGREPLVPGVPHGMVGQLVRFGIVGVASTLAYALLYLVLHPDDGCAGRQPDRTADHRDRQHRSQPGVHVRHPRPGRRRPPSDARIARLRVRAGHHQRIAVRAAPLRPDGRQGDRVVDPRRGQSGRHRGAVRRPAVGVRGAPHVSRARWSLTALLIGSAVLYMWDLGAQGWANAFYSAAAQAGSQSWKAFLFGSSDAASSITVDKPPMSLWPMALSVRAFGLNPWSILVPQALAGVATVALVWDTVRRRFGEAAGLIAGLVFALTPVAVAIFRHNNPDALLVLFLAAALWAALRAVDDGRTRWLVLCGALIGGGYLTKQLVVVLMLPALFVPYLVAGPPVVDAAGLAGRARRRRRRRLPVAGGCAMVQLWPVADRPWIGGSQHNSELELTFGYNGFGRISGHEVGGVGMPADHPRRSPTVLTGRDSAGCSRRNRSARSDGCCPPRRCS